MDDEKDETQEEENPVLALFRGELQPPVDMDEDESDGTTD